MTTALYLAATSVETRSRTWVWVVGVGLVVATVLIGVILRGVVNSLPEDVRGPVRSAGRANATPLGVGVAILIATVVFALYSAGLPTVSATGVAAENTKAVTDDAAPVDSGGATDTAAVDAPGGTTKATSVAGRSTATTKPKATVSLGAPPVAVNEANLYSGAANTSGITSNSIKLCGHAPLSLGAVLNTSADDLSVFWRWLNDKGGLYGRKFDVSLEDDQYTAEGGVPAAQKCAEKSPFMIFGAIGSDVLPPVRVWAEQNKQLYLYGFTIKKGSENMRYSYTGTISQEELSLVIAKLAVAKYPGKKVGLVWRNSSNFQPGRDVFKSYVSSHGSTVVADLPVQKSQGSYSNEIIELQQKGAEVVFVLDDALAQLNVIKQGKTQNYNPHWLVFTFNAQTKALGDDALNPPIQGANLAPSYVCHTFDGSFAPYAAELHEFEDAYAKYSPDTDLCGIAGDIAWGTWLGFKAMAALFEACGPNCTRNRWAGVMESGYKGQIGAACPFDWSGDGHHGGHTADLMEAYRAPNGTAGFRNFQRCASASG